MRGNDLVTRRKSVSNVRALLLKTWNWRTRHGVRGDFSAALRSRDSLARSSTLRAREEKGKVGEIVGHKGGLLPRSTTRRGLRDFRVKRFAREQLPSGCGVLRALEMHFLHSPPRTPTQHFSSSRSVATYRYVAESRKLRLGARGIRQLVRTRYATILCNSLQNEAKLLRASRPVLVRSIGEKSPPLRGVAAGVLRETFWLASFPLRMSSRCGGSIRSIRSRTSFKSKRHVSS